MFYQSEVKSTTSQHDRVYSYQYHCIQDLSNSDCQIANNNKGIDIFTLDSDGFSCSFTCEILFFF